MSRCSYAISSTVIATIIGGVAYFLSFKGFQLHMFRHLLPFLLHHLLQGQEPVLPELNPLVGVPHAGILYQSTKDHEEANKEVNVYGLHVGYLGQGSIDRVDEGGHGEHGGHAQANTGGRCSSVQPEGHPGHHHYQAGGDVHLEIFD